MEHSNEFYKINPHVRYASHVTGTSEDYHVPYRMLYDFELMYVVDGTFHVKTQTAEYFINRGQLLIIPPFLYHKQQIDPGAPCEYHAIHMDFIYDEANDFSCYEIYNLPCQRHTEAVTPDPVLMKRETPGPSEVSRIQVVDIRNPHFELLFREIEALFANQNKLSVLSLKAKMFELIRMILSDLIEAGDADYSENIINDFVDFITENFKSDINISELAKQYGFSPNYFRKLFREKLAKSPKEYLIDMRMNEAKKLLRLGTYTISEISYMVGYDDLHYFSRLFKSKEGISPAVFAKTPPFPSSDK